MTNNFGELPQELTSRVLYYSRNLNDQLVCKDWKDEIQRNRCIALSNPDKYIRKLHPFIKYLLYNHDHRRKILRLIGKRGRTDLLKEYKHFFTKKWFLNKAFNIACRYDDKELIDYFISKGASDWNDALKHAALGGHMDVIYFLIDKGANDWNSAMAYAALGGHLDIVNFFVSLGADHWTMATFMAVRGGHEDLVDFFIGKGFRDWDGALAFAVYGNHKELIDFFISKGANDWNGALIDGVRGGHQELVEFLISKGASNFETAIEVAALSGHKHIVEFLFGLRKNYTKRTLNNAMRRATRRGDKEIIDFLITKGADNWFACAIVARQAGHEDLVEFFESKINNQ